MPELPKTPKGKPKGKGGARIFGFPWYVVAGGVVAAIALGLYLRHRSSSSGSAGTTAAPAQDTSGGAGGGSSSPTDAPAGQQIDLTGLQNSLDQLGYLLSYGPTSTLDSSGPGPTEAPLVALSATAPTNPYVGAAAVGPASDAQFGYAISRGEQPWQAALEARGSGMNAFYGIGAVSQGVLVDNKIFLAPSKSPVSYPQAPGHPAPSGPEPHPSVVATYRPPNYSAQVQTRTTIDHPTGR